MLFLQICILLQLYKYTKKPDLKLITHNGKSNTTAWIQEFTLQGFKSLWFIQYIQKVISVYISSCGTTSMGTFIHCSCFVKKKQMTTFLGHCSLFTLWSVCLEFSQCKEKLSSWNLLTNVWSLVFHLWSVRNWFAQLKNRNSFLTLLCFSGYFLF